MSSTNARHRNLETEIAAIEQFVAQKRGEAREFSRLANEASAMVSDALHKLAQIRVSMISRRRNK